MGRYDTAPRQPAADRRGDFMMFRPFFALAIMGVAWVTPARAADVVFPLASHVGIVAPAGMTASQTFRGFEDRAASASILIVEIPSQAYATIEKQLSPEALKKEGM